MEYILVPCMESVMSKTIYVHFVGGGGGILSWTRSYKKDGEPLLNLTGATREGPYTYKKEGTL